MYDNILVKSAVSGKLAEAGYSAEEIEKSWGELVKIFEHEVFASVCSRLSHEQVVEALGGEEVAVGEMDKHIEKLRSYILEKSPSMDMKQVVDEARIRALDKFYQSQVGGANG